MKLNELTSILNERLCIADFVQADSSLNGLQVGSLQAPVRKVAFAVDACLEAFIRAAELKADLLIVHHGLFWGRPIAVTGRHYERVKTLLDNNLALYACHLPLDAHPVLGNNASIARVLGLEDVKSFGFYHGKFIGYSGILPKALDGGEIIGLLGLENNPGIRVLPFGKEKNRTVGIISGGAAFDVHDALDLGLDAYITGESSHSVYHDCLEGGINMFCLGHYATETFGVKAVMDMVEKDFGLETCFVDIPTSL